LEEEYLFENNKMQALLEKYGDRDGDLFKARVLDAEYRYEYISNTLGPESPAKMDAILKAQRAEAEATLQAMTENIVKAKDLQQVMKYVAQATKNTSKLPGILAEAATSDDMKTVLEKIREKDDEDQYVNLDMARELSKNILASTSADQVADAFNAIFERIATTGKTDPEELLQIKLTSQVGKFVTRAGLRFGEIKAEFITAA
jgi:cell pole-organizing protein PopZ